MPISQNRLIALTDIAQTTLDWAEHLRKIILIDKILIINARYVAERVGNGEFPPQEKLKNLLLDLANQIEVVMDNLRENPLPMELYQNLAKEIAHFQATSKKNTKAAQLSRARRAVAKTTSPQENTIATVTEIAFAKKLGVSIEELKEIDEDLRKGQGQGQGEGQSNSTAFPQKGESMADLIRKMQELPQGEDGGGVLL